jgi:4-carboxymuconolactone decarboxylase
MAPRIDPVERPDGDQRELLAKTLPGPDGAPLNIFRTLAHRPQLLRRVNALGGYFMLHGDLEARDRELVILRTAAHARSAYEIGQHRWLGARAGLSSAEIEAALDPAAGHPWSSEDRALLAFTDELAATDTVSDAAWDALADRLDDLQRAELLVLAGFYRMLAGVLNGLGVELDPAVEQVLEAP